MVDRITFRWITVLYFYIKEDRSRFIRPLDPTATSDTMPPNTDMISVMTNDQVILLRPVDPPKNGLTTGQFDVHLPREVFLSSRSVIIAGCKPLDNLGIF